MYDGSSALILAARLAVEGMVEELITCHADVNAVDELGKYVWFFTQCSSADLNFYNRVNPKTIDVYFYCLFSLAGKSALHWAAAVNNVEATVALLKNGANKDMQDLKVCYQCTLF